MTVEVNQAFVPAQTPATLFRWRQLSNSGLGEDNWMLDDVAIAADETTGITNRVIIDWRSNQRGSSLKPAMPITYTPKFASIIRPRPKRSARKPNPSAPSPTPASPRRSSARCWTRSATTG